MNHPCMNTFLDSELFIVVTYLLNKRERHFTGLLESALVQMPVGWIDLTDPQGFPLPKTVA